MLFAVAQSYMKYLFCDQFNAKFDQAVEYLVTSNKYINEGSKDTKKQYLNEYGFHINLYTKTP